ncbi:MAG: hypothetical protein EOM24_29380 [Chloroflexia bacterium]|nr:hypothetical protein [Chloroflexia bacterium]
MTTLHEPPVACTFPEGWIATNYDTWAFYRNQLSTCCGSTKAVDFLAYAPDRTLWLIEVKDYRQYRREKGVRLWDEVALKARDTLAGIVATRVNGANDEQLYAAQALRARRIRVVLHLEQPRTSSKLFPRPFDPADMQQKLRQLIRAIDPHPKVIDLSTTDTVPWTTTMLPPAALAPARGQR